jgi:hypothetical protein
MPTWRLLLGSNKFRIRRKGRIYRWEYLLDPTAPAGHPPRSSGFVPALTLKLGCAQTQLSFHHGARQKPGREQFKWSFFLSLATIKLRHSNYQLPLVHGSTEYPCML